MFDKYSDKLVPKGEQSFDMSFKTDVPDISKLFNNYLPANYGKDRIKGNWPTTRPFVVGIFAQSWDGIIGKKGESGLPWHCPNDLANFKAITNDAVVIMGTNTMCSINAKLQGRHEVIYTRVKFLNRFGETMKIIDSPSRLIDDPVNYPDGSLVFVIGGEKTFADFNHLVDQWIVSTMPMSLDNGEDDWARAPFIDMTKFKVTNNMDIRAKVDGKDDTYNMSIYDKIGTPEA